MAPFVIPKTESETMKNDTVYVTAAGLEQMKTELEERIEVKRPAIAERLEAAIKMGDLKENADYHAAKEDQAFNEGRIKELEYSLHRVKVIEHSGGSDVVRIGSTVTVAEVGYEDEEETYRIVGAHEADPSKGFISNESPVGSALLGAKAGAEVIVQTPRGALKFKVIHVD